MTYHGLTLVEPRSNLKNLEPQMTRHSFLNGPGFKIILLAYILCFLEGKVAYM